MFLSTSRRAKALKTTSSSNRARCSDEISVITQKAKDRKEVFNAARTYYHEYHHCDLPNIIKPHAEYGFLVEGIDGSGNPDRVAAIVLEPEHNPQEQQWKEIRDKLREDGVRFEIWQQAHFKPWKVAINANLGILTFVILLLGFLYQVSPPFGKRSNPEPPEVSCATAQACPFYIEGPLNSELHKSDDARPRQSASQDTVANGTSSSEYTAPPESSSDPVSDTNSAVSVSFVNPKTNDDPIQRNLEQYLNDALRPYIKTSTYKNVHLLLTQPLMYSHDSGTATCTIDGSIESDQGTLLQSHSYTQPSSGAEDTTHLIEDACHNAIDQMVQNYRQVMAP